MAGKVQLSEGVYFFELPIQRERTRHLGTFSRTKGDAVR